MGPAESRAGRSLRCPGGGGGRLPPSCLQAPRRGSPPAAPGSSGQPPTPLPRPRGRSRAHNAGPPQGERETRRRFAASQPMEGDARRTPDGPALVPPAPPSPALEGPRAGGGAAAGPVPGLLPQADGRAGDLTRPSPLTCAAPAGLLRLRLLLLSAGGRPPAGQGRRHSDARGGAGHVTPGTALSRAAAERGAGLSSAQVGGRGRPRSRHVCLGRCPSCVPAPPPGCSGGCF